jgi:hypothetical protein
MLTKKHGNRYPWDDWFRDPIVTLYRGTHYTCQTHGMMRNALQAAKSRGLKLSIKMRDSHLTITILDTE